MDVERLVRQAGLRMPEWLTRRLSVLYNRYETRQADQTFARKSLPSRGRAEDAPAHVVCVVVDCLRDSSVTPGVAPFVDGLAGTDAVATAPWTFSSVTSILTGEYPHEHGSIRQTDHRGSEGPSDMTLPPRYKETGETLPEVLSSYGYRTAGFFGFYMPFLAARGNFSEHALFKKGAAPDVLGRAVEWIRSAPEEPSFSYVHLGDLHTPIDVPEQYCRRHEVDDGIDDLEEWRHTDVTDPTDEQQRYMDHRERLYDAAIEYVDDAIAGFRERLEETTGEVALVVTSDHGEGFWEHAALDADTFADSRPAYCVGHGGTQYEPVVRVPLRFEGVDVDLDADPPTSLVDIAPTLVDVVAGDDETVGSGRSLLSPPPTDRVLLTEATRYGSERKAVYREGWKLLVSRGDDAEVGFRLPEESVADPPEEVRADLREQLPAWPDGDEADATRVSGEARSRLEKLGYV